ncbi:hypothetical protein JL721_5550 [Aureococcus anophagefferens]|nr:hypothetical protein JL721_5550 [Aureococcus anophagefferens]
MRRCADRVGDVEELAPLRRRRATGGGRQQVRSDARRSRDGAWARASDELAELELPGPADPARAPERLDGLLDFLERGFGGGTDVISPLRRAVALLRARPAFADADVLLVSDGELMDPPVDAATAADLDALRRSRGLRVAGSWAGAAGRRLGTRRREPFDALCDGVHEAPAVFFDEIFRARSLLPALLALLNERVWQDGPRRRPAALVSAVAAANTLGGDDDDDDDDALYDRFLIRREVAPVFDAAVADLLLGDDVDGACPRAFLAPLLAVPAAAGRAAAGRELPDDDDEFAAAPRAAPAPAPGDDDDFDLTMSKKKAKKELTAAEFRRWTAARADLRG